jgi:hypothetical protein
MKNRTVDIHARPDGNGGYDFKMKEGGADKTRLVFDKTQDNMPKNEDYRVFFKLHNEQNADLRFSSIPAKVLWAKPIADPSEPCPNCESYMDGIFYLDPSATIEKRQITVINTDPTQQLFAFAMNFVPDGTVEGPDTQYIWFDPIGDNRNGGFTPPSPGGTSFSLNSPIGMTVIAVVAVVAIAFFLFR